MPAIGFGQKVTGGTGATAANTIPVTNGGGSGTGTLAQAILTANANSTEAKGYPKQEIVIRAAVTVAANTKDLTITARNLTIRAEGRALINRNHLVFDCTDADNIILRNLRFESDGVSDPRDCISIDGTKGRGPTGFWIDGCHFEAYFDLSITVNTADLPKKNGKKVPHLLITVSGCRFHDRAPSGRAHKNHGAVGIHGTGGDKPDKKTNAYATVCRNVFDHVRRRSPRSSHRTFVHAFNNVLIGWGSNDITETQQNGMESGHDGILLASANYFKPNKFTQTIDVATDPPARLTATTGDRKNLVIAPAIAPKTVGAPINKDVMYQAGLGTGGVIPLAEVMTDALRATIEKEADPLHAT